ncbi:peptidoglycan DD-metalloendopeptidase family protein [Ruminiclostridium cellobioparum]|uniref:Peptidase M23 n=1 Tax=Ruminiclostridium cellobioparum subsp. termitidis CT1112 TaxID=1195236 RepID=S0FT41_RUMCE|nr:peptidoglycan DD-metalloendopeptidase family protein [Ruminiclostridium cellobioparum]EMS72324.1 peptidase M23 [Ruminiclostridium cellobioparum subsp. termitidis CT1112]
MAINPALIKAAVQVLSSKEGRKGLLISILIPVFLLFFVVCIFAYVLMAPIDFLSSKLGLSGYERTTIENAQDKYRDYIKPENKVIDRGGFYSYPSDGTTGSRGFSATPVPHPVLGISRPHWGQDFNSEWHSNVYSIADGQVYDLGFNDEAGMYVTIYHNVDGRQFFTRYLHLSAIHAIPDSKVKQGDVIASEGGEPKKEEGKPYDYYPGTSTGHHLHFEVREGSSYGGATPVDPKLYIDPIPVEISCTHSDSSGSEPTGSITVKIKGGRERGYDISLDGGSSWTNTQSKTYTFENLGSGTYSVVARDASYIKNISKISHITIDTIPSEPDDEDEKKPDKKGEPKKNESKK